MFKYLEALTAALRLLRLKLTVVWVTSIITLNSFITQTADVARERHHHEGSTSHRRRPDLSEERVLHARHRVPLPDPVRCRHVEGRRQVVVRGASLKFADQRRTSPLDLLMNSGELANALERTHVPRLHEGHGGRSREELDAVPAHTSHGCSGRPRPASAATPPPSVPSSTTRRRASAWSTSTASTTTCAIACSRCRSCPTAPPHPTTCSTPGSRTRCPPRHGIATT